MTKKNKTARKLLALAMTLVAVFALFAGTVQAYAAHCNDDPYVFLHGDGHLYRFNDDGTVTELYDDADYTSSLLSKAGPLAAKAYLTGDWTEWSDVVFADLSKAYDGIRPNPDGTLPPNSGVNWSWSPDSISGWHTYNVNSCYEYWPDSRLSPLVVADDIHAFIETIKQKTGHDRVHLLSRCEGSAYMLAYMYKYGRENNYADFASATFFEPAVNGMGFAEAAYSGNVVLSDKTLHRFLRDGTEMNIEVGDDVMGVLATVYNAMHDTFAMDFTVAQANKIYEGIKDVFMARLMRDFYGRCLGYVTAVNEKYEEFKKYVFYEQGDAETFAAIISQADDFHYNVQMHFADIVNEAKADGVPVNVIVEYGFQQYPFSAEAEYVGTYMASVREQSIGAVCSKMEETLSDAYIAERTAAGYGDLISPDRQVDASTALMPDNTWYIKNCNHEFPWQIENFYSDLVHNPDATVDTLPGYSRFMNYDANASSLQPLQAVNENDSDYTPSESREEATGKIFNKLYSWIQGLFDKLFRIIEKIVAIFN